MHDSEGAGRCGMLLLAVFFWAAMLFFAVAIPSIRFIVKALRAAHAAGTAGSPAKPTVFRPSAFLRLSSWRRWISAGLWAASAYAALAFFILPLRFGPLVDVTASVRGRFVGLVYYSDGRDLIGIAPDNREAAACDDSAGVCSIRLWGTAPAYPSYAPGAPDSAAPYPLDAQAHAFGDALRGQRMIALQHGTDHRNTVAEIRLASGRDLGTEMILHGLARWDQQQAPHADYLRRAEEEARAKGRGLWAHTARMLPATSAVTAVTEGDERKATNR